MRELRLEPREMPTIPLEAEVISPDVLAGRKIQEIEGLTVYVGNERYALGEFFDVGGEVAERAGDQLIVVDGDVPNVKYVGMRMTSGHVLVKGSVGMHAGAQMSGGELTVEGSAFEWAGAEMKGGLLRIGGDAGHQLGAAYRGSSEGMTGGCIVVGGDAGLELGSFMRRGMIVIRGGVGPFAGVHMNGGEIFVFGPAARRLGAEAKGNGGFIACFGEVESLLPTYVYDTTYQPTFMKLYLRQMKDALGVDEAGKFIDASFRRYRGDLAVGGNGEILVAER